MKPAQTTQLDVAATQQPRPSSQHRTRLALVLLASRSEPERVGEVWLPPPSGGAGLLGRLVPSEAADHVGWVRQRPGSTTHTGALQSPSISRVQLRVAQLRDAALHIENLGRRALLVDGREVQQATLRAGATLELLSEALLLVVARPSPLPAARWLSQEQVEATPFGGADRHGIVGESPAIWRLRDELAFAMRGHSHALVSGPSGAGKELVARALHGGAGPFVARSAATLPDALIDAELFGNVRNFPNPGMQARAGLIGAADGGTLFLDEIAELPMAQQPHLLRVLDADGEYQQLGDDRVRRSAFRLVGATNRPLDALRVDFAARFEHRLALPSLRERREDVPLLARHLAALRTADAPERWRRFWSDDGALALSFDWLRALVTDPPEDNVRGLARALTESLRHSVGDRLVAPPGVPTDAQTTPSPPSTPATACVAPDVPPSPETIQACLDKHGGVQGPVWRELGFKNRYQLQRLIRKHGLRTAASEPGDDDEPR
jgi:DNA-binding NtrC family response regulator